jgi:transglutaminase-like putative cysteine protease
MTTAQASTPSRPSPRPPASAPASPPAHAEFDADGRKARWLLRTILTLTALLAAVAYAIAAEKPGLALLSIAVAAFSMLLIARSRTTDLPGATIPQRVIPRWVLNTLVVAAMLHLLARFTILEDADAPITRLADFLTLVMLVKMLDRFRIRDEMQLLGLACFVTIGALLTGQSLSLGLALIFLVPLAITSSILLQLHAGRERAFQRARAAQDEDLPLRIQRGWANRRTHRSALVLSLACALMASTLAIVVFVLAPRNLAQQAMNAAFANSTQPRGTQTGFRDNIRLGESGLISESTEVVMDVVLREADGQQTRSLSSPLYLRGSVLTQYDPQRREWSSGQEVVDMASREIEGSGVVRVGERTAGRVRRSAEITTRSGQSASVAPPMFAPLRAITIRAPDSPSGPARVRFFPASSLAYVADWRGGRKAYSIEWLVDYREPDPITWRPPNTDVFPPIVRQTAEQILRADDLDPESLKTASAVDIRRAAVAINAHLRDTFGYTLEQVAPPPDADPLDYFLRESRQGHCEYFAAAMVAMLQSVGVPARIVTGYAAAEFNDISGHIVVRQSDAHAWVEVRLEPGRWETFDPTPPAQLQSARRASRSLWTRARQAWEAIEFSWLDNVVAYDSGLKLDMQAVAQSRGGGAGLVRFQQRVDRAQQAVRRWMPDSTALGAIVVIVVLTVGAGLLFVIFRYGVRILAAVVGRITGRLGVSIPRWLRLGQRRDRGPVITEQTRFYADMLAELRRAGLPKPETDTPLAHAAGPVSTADADAGAAAQRVTSVYYAARFGQQPLTAQDRASVKADIAALRARLAQRTS